ncbi:uncharacterized protein LY79DRAFT_595270 [Colletotrichum navitas]|uniref:Uncharacterized protein n=1 Tax=Colletotrichum navitas TaxID=681940 RepID=A0AAD8PJR3_9PEZI|nr:uncharacterized protein LY79DRAFT_595270 [Colletotrichum navitas]KAK1564243.1 hypothetical protein LY79DRAFT_595270 [Colletotrichum navitas]
MRSGVCGMVYLQDSNGRERGSVLNSMRLTGFEADGGVGEGEKKGCVRSNLGEKVREESVAQEVG